MSVGTLEQTVPRKDPKKPGKPHVPQPAHPSFGRIELQAPPEWIEALDAAADAIGLSRSAYIRMACNRQMAADRREGLKDED